MTTQTFNYRSYWEKRYSKGRSSGAGSEGAEGAYKAAYISAFCREHDVTSVIDWGCGDGQVLELIRFPKGIAYLGVDISPTIVNRMQDKFTFPYEFVTADKYNGTLYRLGLSLDVLFHFPEEKDYVEYLSKLFNSAWQYVMVYSTNHAEGQTARHVYRRKFTSDIENLYPDWALIAEEPPLEPGLASFFVYEKKNHATIS